MLDREGETVELLKSQKARALLAYLALRGREIRRDVLAEMLWADVADSRASLRWSLSRLRSGLTVGDQQPLLADRENASVDPALLGSDWARVKKVAGALPTVSIDELEDAVASFGGTLLADVSLPDCPRFESWLIAERQEARGLERKLTLALLDRLASEPSRALPVARGLREREMDDDAALLPLLRVLTALGESEEAAQHYEQQRRRAKEGGRALAPALVTWRMQTKATASTAASNAPEAVAEAAPTPVDVPLALTIAVDDHFPFVGRTEQLSKLVALAASKQAAVCLLGGAPGVGKSRLAIQAAETIATDGARVCAGRCDEHVPMMLGPWRDALKQIAMHDPTTFSQQCRGVAATMAALLPSMADALFVDAPAGGGELETYVAIDAVCTVLSRLAEQAPLVVVIDDLQWSDEPTRALVASLPRRLATTPVMVIATYRSTRGDLDNEVRRWIRECARLPNVERLAIEGLGETAAAELAREALDDEQAARLTTMLYERSQGHGVFLTEMLREIQRGGDGSAIPSTIADLVRVRYERLDPDVAALVCAGAFLGPEFSVNVASAALETSVADALERAEHAIEADLLHATARATHLRFSHQLVPRAIREIQSGPRRARWHHRAALALEAEGGDEVDIAMHLLGASPLVDVQEALDRAWTAARAAHHSFDFDRSERLLRRMLGVPTSDRQRAELNIELGNVLNDGGRTPAGVKYFEEAVGLAEANGWHDLLAKAALGRGGRSPFRKMSDGRSLELLENATAVMDELDAGTAARILAKTAAFQLFTKRLEDREALSSEALQRSADVSPADRLEILEARWVAMGCPSCVDELARLDQEIASLRAQLGRMGADASMPESVFFWRGEGAALRRELKSSIEDPRRRRNIDQWRHRVIGGTVAVLEADVTRARTLFDEASLIGPDCWGESSYVLHALALHICDVVEGVPGNAAQVFGLLNQVSPATVVATCWAWALVRAGELDQAREVMAALRPSSVTWFVEHIVGGAALCGAAEVAVALDLEEWAAVTEQELRRVDGLMLGLPWAPALAASHVLAHLLAHRGEEAEAQEKREAARRLYERVGAPGLSRLLE